jgi:pyruvate, water dikinase
MGGMRVRVAIVMAVAAGCGGDAPQAPCEPGRVVYRSELRCREEMAAQGARPLDASLPGAVTVKTIVDRAGEDAVYFQDTEAYAVHRRFAVEQLGWPPGAPFVEQYLSPGRRFLLGAITHYEEPDVVAYEIAPYDTASVELVERAFERIEGAMWDGNGLRFHPTSEEQEALAREMSIPIVTTDELWEGITYQPLNLGETYARVKVITAAELATTYVSPREIVVLDRVPNDLTVVAGVVTAELQTPLSHVNVLSQQRGTPNMGLRGAQERFASMADRWVRLTVGAFAWEVVEVTAEEADAWWQDHRPPPVEVPAPDYGVSAVRDIDDVGTADIPVFGGKAAHYGALRDLADGGAPIRIRDALAVPVVFYRDFLAANGFDDRIAAMLIDPGFRNDGNVRRQMLDALRADMIAAPVDAGALAAIEAAVTGAFPATRMKFRSSTNAEDLAHHTGAGLYESASGQPGDPQRPVDVALKTVWASVWNVRAFEERDYAGIDHTAVAMAVLVTPSFSDEAANGVAITANIYDPAPGGEDGFFVNGQLGEASVVQPSPGVTADSLLYYHFHAGQPATYYTRSNLIAPGTTVLTRSELFDLGRALEAIRDGFDGVYEPPPGYGFLPMDVEWKLVDDAGTRTIWIKQARPYPGRGMEES